MNFKSQISNFQFDFSLSFPCHPPIAWRRNMNKFTSLSAAGLVLVLSTAASTKSHRPLDPDKLRKIDTAIDKAIDEQRLPGAVIWVDHGGEHYWKAFGNRALVPNEE